MTKLVTLAILLITMSFFNSLWPSDAIWRHRSWSTLAQVMACYPFHSQGWGPSSDLLGFFIPSTSAKLKVGGGVYWFHVFRLSVRPSVDKIVSALYLPQYWLNPFHICTSYQPTSVGVSIYSLLQNPRIRIFGKFFKFLTLILSCYDMGSDMNP